MITKSIIEYLLLKEIRYDGVDLHNITSRRLDLYLYEEKIINKEQLVDLWCSKFNFKKEDITYFDINKSTISKISVALMNKLLIIPFEETNKFVKILIDDPFKVSEIAEIEQIYKKRTELYYMDSDDMKNLINLFFVSTDITKSANDYDKVMKLLDSLIKTSSFYNASDLHFKISEKEVELFYRIDGVLKELTTIDLNSYHQLITKVKILSNLDITITLAPQDGHFLYQKGQLKVDVRVSTIPTIDGERLVLRFFNSASDILTIDNLGFTQQQLNTIKENLHGGGIVFVTGPTGSGKTTTLYSFLNYLKQDNRNIMTVEDPIEKRIEGVTQIPLNMLDYPTILKSLVRQDPDVIMLGEIRDAETAKMAVRLAQTGHLILSTIHTNDSIGVISRLENMGIPKYLIVDAIKLVISQRLLRKPCPECRAIEKEYCDKCHHTGYSGRIMVSEVLNFDSKIKEYIMLDNYKKLITDYKVGNFLMDTANLLLSENLITMEEIIRTGINLE